MSFRFSLHFCLPKSFDTLGEEGRWFEEFYESFQSVLAQLKGDDEFQINKVQKEFPIIDGSDVVVFYINNALMHSRDELTAIDSFILANPSVRVFNFFKDKPSGSVYESVFYQKGAVSFDNISTSDYSYFARQVDLGYEVLGLFPEYTYHSYSENETQNIFIAETYPELESSRDRLKRELISKGYNVFPKYPLPTDKIRLEEEIVNILSKCCLSVHIINENYNQDNSSFVELQNELVQKINLISQQDLHRLVWAPPVDETDEKQVLFIERLKRHSKALDGAEFIQVPVEKLKNISVNRLEKIKAKNELPVYKQHVYQSNEPLVYVINTKEDKNNTDKIIQALESKGIKVIPSDFEGDEIELLEKHRFYLANCDGSLIYHSGVNEQWLQMKLLDMLKAPGYGRKKPMKGKALYIENETIDVSPLVNLTNFEIFKKTDFESVDFQFFIEKIVV